MKRARRLLSMVTETPGGFSLSRVDANRHLFFPSTAQAIHHRQIEEQQIQAAAKDQEKAAPQKEDYGGALPLPPPKVRFESWPSDMASYLQFFPFNHSKVLCVEEAGGAVLHDLDDSSVQIMPSLTGGLRRAASFAVTHADADDPDCPDALYVMDDDGFQALVYGDRPCKGFLDSGSYAWHWRQLPPPPFDVDGDSFSLHSYALLHGSTICVSFLRWSSQRSTHVPGCTYCFDTTGAREWTKVGDWTLPFYSRALHVPELGEGILFGIYGMHGHHFGAVDVSCINNTPNRPSSAPVLRHKWVDVDPPPPPEWHLRRESVSYLGAGRFCIHRGFDINFLGGYGDWDTDDTVTLLTGVEVVREAGSSKLRLVKHKTKRIDDIDHLL